MAVEIPWRAASARRTVDSAGHGPRRSVL